MTDQQPDLWERLRAEVADGEQRLIGAVQHAQAEERRDSRKLARLAGRMAGWLLLLWLAGRGLTDVIADWVDR